MERCLIWYRLWMKVFVRKKSYWLQLAGMILLLIVIASVSLPDSKNVMVGICINDSSYAEKISQGLINGNSVFEYKIYDDNQLYEDILSGKIECGFIFSEDFDSKIDEGNLKNSITYVTTPLSSKGEVVKETVYSEILRIYSDNILKESENEIYGNGDNVSEERIRNLIEQNHIYQEGNDVFQLDIKEIDIKYPDGVTGEKSKIYPIQGMAGIVIFLIMFLAYGQKFDDTGNMVQKALTKREQFIYGYINTFAAGTLPAIVGIVLIAFLADSRGIVVELLMMLIFVLLSGVWIMIVGSIFRKSTTFVASIMTIVIANLLLCPVFLNLDMFVPAIKYISLIFPLGIYLY